MYKVKLLLRSVVEMSSHVPKHVKDRTISCLFHTYFQVLVQHLPTATDKNSPTAWATKYFP